MAYEAPSQRRLLSVIHYHHRSKGHPSPYVIEAGVEVVELVTGGRGWVRQDEQWIEVRPGALLWHIEGDETIGRSDPETPYSCLAVTMQRRDDADSAPPRLSIWPDDGEVVAFTEQAVRLFLDEGFERSILLEYVYARLRFVATLYHRQSRQAGVVEPLRIVRSAIEARYAEPLKISDLARLAAWSVAHLHEQYQAVFGSTPKRDLIDRRLKAAKELLVGSGQSVKQIAADTGFTHSSAFCGAFKRRFGCSPQAFREGYSVGFGQGT